MIKCEIFSKNLSNEAIKKINNVKFIKIIHKNQGEVMILEDYMNTIFAIEQNSNIQIKSISEQYDFHIGNDDAIAIIENNNIKIFC